jgi:hypothetical protein
LKKICNILCKYNINIIRNLPNKIHLEILYPRIICVYLLLFLIQVIFLSLVFRDIIIQCIILSSMRILIYWWLMIRMKLYFQKDIYSKNNILFLILNWFNWHLKQIRDKILCKNFKILLKLIYIVEIYIARKKRHFKYR